MRPLIPPGNATGLWHHTIDCRSPESCLGVPYDATARQLTAAFRRKLRAIHPRITPDLAEVIHERQRAEYDAHTLARAIHVYWTLSPEEPEPMVNRYTREAGERGAALLGVPADATPKQVVAAFRAWLRTIHPQLTPDVANAILHYRGRWEDGLRRIEECRRHRVPRTPPRPLSGQSVFWREQMHMAGPPGSDLDQDDAEVAAEEAAARVAEGAPAPSDEPSAP